MSTEVFLGRRAVVIRLLETLRDAVKADNWVYGEHSKAWSQGDAQLCEIVKAMELCDRAGVAREVDYDGPELEEVFTLAIRLAQALG
jgi:hypothetical protein